MVGHEVAYPVCPKSAQKGSVMKITLTSNEVVAALALPARVRALKFFDHGHRDCVVGFGLRIRHPRPPVGVFQYNYGDKHNRMERRPWPRDTLETARGERRKYR